MASFFFTNQCKRNAIDEEEYFHLRVTRPECNDQRYVEGKTEWASPMRVPIWRHPCRERETGEGRGKKREEGN